MPIRRVYQEQAEGTFDVDLDQFSIFPQPEYVKYGIIDRYICQTAQL